MMQAKRIYFVDFEASSLERGSAPIEIAWVSATGQGESYLIKPERHWTDWSDQAERLHGISQTTLLRDGVAASRVANRAFSVLDGGLLVSDNPAFDQFWMGTLMSTVSLSQLDFISLDDLLNIEIERYLKRIRADENDNTLRDRAHRVVFDAKGAVILGHQVRHRALPDAQFLWSIWRNVVIRLRQEIPK